VVLARRGNAVSAGMREWSLLGWYELAAFAVVHGRCCEAPLKLDHPAFQVCGMGAALGALHQAARSGASTDAEVARYSEAARCAWKSKYADPFSQTAQPTMQQLATFGKTLARVGGGGSRARRPRGLVAEETVTLPSIERALQAACGAPPASRILTVACFECCRLEVNEPTMRTLALSAGLTVLVCLAAACSPYDEESVALGNTQDGIVNGSVNNGDPAVVALTVWNQAFCSGTLITPTVVLTAAHCLPPNLNDVGIYDYTDISVFFGTYVGNGESRAVVNGWTDLAWTRTPWTTTSAWCG